MTALVCIILSPLLREEPHRFADAASGEYVDTGHDAEASREFMSDR